RKCKMALSKAHRAGWMAAVLMTLSARADTVTIGSANDTTIFARFVNNSDGGGPGMFAGTDGTSNSLRGLMKFSVAAVVPAGSTITDVQLTLNLGLVAGSGGSPDTTPRTITLNHVTSDWGEGTQGNSFTMIEMTGAGFPAQSGD